MKKISEAVNLIKQYGLYPEPPIVYSPHAPEVLLKSGKVLMFATNNYLGMMADSRVIEAAVEGVKKWGIGNGSARLLTGNLEIHHTLEKAIAQFKHRPAALTFVSGYAANEGAIQATVNVLALNPLAVIKELISWNRNTIIFSDELNHASIVAGVKASGAHKEIYKHRDIEDLQKKLKKYSKSQRKLIVTDGVFSMDGDIAPLPGIIELAKQYNCIVYLDDAHATGVLGKHGRGVEDYFNIEGESDIVMGTFTKAFGGVGGFVTSNMDFIDYLRVTAKTFIFTAPIAPPVVCGLIESIKIVENETWRRETVVNNAKYLRDELVSRGIDICGSETQIVPILVGDEKKAIAVSDFLLKEGILVPAARWPAVPEGKARLRVTVCAQHTKEQLDYLIDVVVRARKQIDF